MTVVATNNSTNVRNSLPFTAALALRVGAALAPTWTAERAIDRFLGTTRRPSTAAQSEFRESGERIVLGSDGATIVARAWGRGPLVYLLHGWNGSVTDFRHLVPAIVAAGYRVIAVDAAGHGESDGNDASAVHLARALEAVARTFGPAVAVVAHSLGGAAAAFAMAEGTVRADRLVLIAPVAEPSQYVEAVGEDIGPEFANRLLQTLERRVGVLGADLALSVSAVALDQPVLVVHDTDDRETRLAPVARVVAAWPSAVLVRTDGLGHRRILADRAVAATIVGALKGTNVRVCSHARVPELCTACALEHELYHRDERAA